eukprot:256553-Rhodomonas_salina.1
MLLGFSQQYGVPPNRTSNAVPFLFAVKTLCLWRGVVLEELGPSVKTCRDAVERSARIEDSWGAYWPGTGSRASMPCRGSRSNSPLACT